MSIWAELMATKRVRKNVAAAAFLAKHGLADRDVIGALERMDLLIG